MIPVTSTDYDDALAMDSFIIKKNCLLEFSTSYDVFELKKEAVESLDAGCFPSFRKAFINGKCKVGWAKPESPMYL